MNTTPKAIAPPMTNSTNPEHAVAELGDNGRIFPQSLAVQRVNFLFDQFINLALDLRKKHRLDYQRHDPYEEQYPARS